MEKFRGLLNCVRNFMCLYLLIGGVAYADIKYGCYEGMSLCVIMVHGNIAIQDVENMKIATAKLNKKNQIFSVAFESNGGDIYAAMELGREIRKHKLMTRVASNGKCLSSCIFSFLGGVIRYAGPGVIGLHAPYAYLDAKDTAHTAKIRLEKMKAKIREYLAEMNIQDDVLNLMLRIPTDEMYFLKDKELVGFGITGEDVLWRELALTKTAKSYGLSRQEYQQRRDIVQKVCGPLFPSIDAFIDSKGTFDDSKYQEQLKLYNDCSKLIYTGKTDK